MKNNITKDETERIIRNFLEYPKSKGVELYSDKIANKLIKQYIKEKYDNSNN